MAVAEELISLKSFADTCSFAFVAQREVRAPHTPAINHAISQTGAQTTSGLVLTRNPADGNEVTHVKITSIRNGALFLNDGVTPVVDGDFVSFAEAAKGFKFTPAAGFSGTATFGVRASTSDDDEGVGGDVVTAKIYVVPTFTNTNDTLYLIANTPKTEVEVYPLDPFVYAVDPLLSWPIDLPQTLTLNTLAGDDQIFVQPPAGMNGPSGGIRFDAGSGTNLLTVRGGNLRIDSTSTGGNLITIVTAGAHLTTARLDQFRLALQGTETKVTLLPGGGVSVLDDLELSLGTTLDVTNNPLVLHSTEANKDGKYADLRAKIQTAQNGIDENFITNWTGTGLTSSAVRSSNVASGFDLVNLGLIRNSDIDVITGLPGSAYTSFDGEPVGPHDLLLKYTYTGDGNLDGVVSFDDYVGIDNAFFGLIPNLGWATGDINFDNLINFDDYSVVDQAFFFQGGPLSVGQAVHAVGWAEFHEAHVLALAEPEASAPGAGEGEAPAEPEFSEARRVSEGNVPPEESAPGVVSTLYPLPPTPSPSDPRLSTSRRIPSRDLWDTALLDILR